MPTIKSERGAAKRQASQPAEEARRAYEHLGRIDILEGALAGSPFVQVTTLVNLAQQQLGAGNSRNAAGLLQAAEHLCFAALSPPTSGDALAADLERSIGEEFKAIVQRAEANWNDEYAPADREAVANMYSDVLAAAQRAFARSALRPALELARAAEALSKTGEGLPASVPNPGLTGRLAS